MGSTKVVTKVCTKCSLELELEKFNKAKLGKHGRDSKCKECKHKEGILYREANRDKILAKSKAYYEANRDEILKRSKQHKVTYRAKHKEEISAYNKEYAKLHKRDPQVVATHRQKNYVKNVARERARTRSYYKSNPEVYIARPKKWKADNPEKSECHKLLHAAIRSGRMDKPSACQLCGSCRPEAHHEDYSKPLEVTWLCAACHKARHRKYNRLELEATWQT